MTLPALAFWIPKLYALRKPGSEGTGLSGGGRPAGELAMEPEQLEKYRAALEAKQAELVELLRRREGIAIEKAADALDEVRLAADRELMIHTLDRESLRLREVRAALKRIEEGSYGICMSCEAPIPNKRLEAVPWAAYCVRCQEAVDGQRGREPGAEVLEEFLGERV